MTVLGTALYSEQGTYNIASRGELALHQGLYGQPLDGSVVIIAQTVVVRGEQVPRQGGVCHTHCQLAVNPAESSFMYLFINILYM